MAKRIPKSDVQKRAFGIHQDDIPRIAALLAADSDVLDFTFEHMDNQLPSTEWWVTVSFAIMSIEELQKEISHRLFEATGSNLSFQNVH